MLKRSAPQPVSSMRSFSRVGWILIVATICLALAFGHLGLPYGQLDWIAYSQAYPTAEPGVESVALGAVADATLDQALPDDNQGDLDAIWVGQAITEQAAARRGLIRFDLSAVPAAATIEDASLELYLGFATELAETEVAVLPVLEEWAESEVTWDTAPASGTQVASTVIGSEGGYYAWDVTQLARDWRSGAAANHGVLLRDLDETTAALRGFTSRESDINPPRLVVEYAAPTPTATQPATSTPTVTLTPTQPATPTPTVTLTATATPTASATPPPTTCDPTQPGSACSATITVRAFVDHRCDGAYISGVDRPIAGAAATVSLPDGTEQTAPTNADGFVTFVRVPVPAGTSVTVSLAYPLEGPDGAQVVACAYSPQTITFGTADFKFGQFKYVEFRGQVATFNIP